MPSRVIISSVNTKTPRNAAVPAARPSWPDEASSRPSMFSCICRPARHMWTVSEATRTAADERQHPFPERLVGRLGEEHAGGDADENRRQNPPPHGRNQALPAGFPQVGEADGHDEERLEAFPQRHDERLHHDDLP